MSDKAAVPKDPLADGGNMEEDADEKVLLSDINKEVDRFFDDSSLSGSDGPHAVVLMGGVGHGKTFTRKQKYAEGYVLIDAPEIFLSLSRGEFLPFPGALKEPMNMVGQMVADRAIEERRNIVTEVIGADKEVTGAMLEALTDDGYKIQVVYIDCSLETAIERNENRGRDNISAHYAQWFHYVWILDTCNGRRKPSEPKI